MYKLKDILKMFANEVYSGCDESDLEEGELDKLKLSYINDVKTCELDGEREGLCFESGYYNGYGDCLNVIVNHFVAINIANESENKEPKTFKSTDLEDMFRNLLK